MRKGVAGRHGGRGGSNTCARTLPGACAGYGGRAGAVEASAARLIAVSYAPRTLATHDTVAEHWKRHQERRGRGGGLPERRIGQSGLDVEVAGFVGYLWEVARVTPGTIKGYVACLKAMLACRGWAEAELETPMARRAIEGAKRRSEHVPERSAALLTPAILKYAADPKGEGDAEPTAAGGRPTQGRIMFCAMVTAFLGLLRFGEYGETVAPDGTRKCLRRRDVSFRGDTVVLELERAKTSYLEGRRVQRAVIGRAPPGRERLDVVDMMRELGAAGPAGPGDGEPVFADLKRPGHAISRDAMTRYVQRVARVSGAAAELGGGVKWTPHGLRAGGAVMLRVAGYSDAEIMRAGRWSSLASFSLYEVGEATRRAMAAGRVLAIEVGESAVGR